MRIPNQPPDAARMTRAQAELARVEARLKRDALKADVIARIVSDTAKNKDVLDRPAMLAALAQDPDNLMELARQAGWLAEEPPATGTDMRRAGTLLGSLLNAFQIPSERTDVVPSRRPQNDSFAGPPRDRQTQEEPAIGPGQTTSVSQLPSVVPMAEPSKTATVTQSAPQQKPATIDGWKNTGLHAPFAFPIQSFGNASPGFFIALALLGAGLFVWLNL